MSEVSSSTLRMIFSGGGSTNGNVAASTGDPLLIVIAVAVVLLAIGLGVYLFKKSKQLKQNRAISNNGAIARTKSKSALIISVAVAIAIVFSFFTGVFAGFHNAAFAFEAQVQEMNSKNQNAASKIIMSPEITCTVDEPTQSITFSGATLTNTTANDYWIDKSTLYKLPGTTDDECTWILATQNATIYSGKTTGQDTATTSNICVPAKSTIDITLTQNGLSYNTAKSMAEKSLMVITLSSSPTADKTAALKQIDEDVTAALQKISTTSGLSDSDKDYFNAKIAAAKAEAEKAVSEKMSEEAIKAAEDHLKELLDQYSEEATKLGEAKIEAATEADEKSGETKASIDNLEDLTEEDKDHYKGFIDTAREELVEALKDCKTPEEVNDLLEEFKAKADAAVEEAKQIASVRANAIKEIEAKQAEANKIIDETTSLSDTEKQYYKDKIAKSVNEAKTNINGSYTVEGIAALKDKCNEDIDKFVYDAKNIKQAKEETKEAIDEKNNEAQAKIDESETLNDTDKEYFENEIQKFKDEADDKIDATMSTDEVKAAQDEFNKKVKETLAYAEKLGEEKVKVIADIETKAQAEKDKIDTIPDLTDEEKDAFKQRVDDEKDQAIEDISDNAKTIEAVNGFKETYDTSMDQIDYDAVNLVPTRTESTQYLLDTSMQYCEAIGKEILLKTTEIEDYNYQIDTLNTTAADLISKAMTPDDVINIKDDYYAQMTAVYNSAYDVIYRRQADLAIKLCVTDVKDIVDTCHNLTKAVRETNDNSYYNQVDNIYNQFVIDLAQKTSKDEIFALYEKTRADAYGVSNKAKELNSKSYWTVKYQTNGGAPIADLKTLQWGDKLTAATTTRTGYKDLKWYQDNGLTQQIDYNVFQVGQTSGDRDNCVLTIYAGWTPITYYVDFNKGRDDSVGTMARQAFTYDQAANLYANCFSNDYGLVFSYWEVFGGGTYSNQASVKNLCSTEGGIVTLYARWKKDDNIKYLAPTTNNDNTWIQYPCYNVSHPVYNMRFYYWNESSWRYEQLDGTSTTHTYPGVIKDAVNNQNFYYKATTDDATLFTMRFVGQWNYKDLRHDGGTVGGHSIKSDHKCRDLTGGKDSGVGPYDFGENENPSWNGVPVIEMAGYYDWSRYRNCDDNACIGLSTKYLFAAGTCYATKVKGSGAYWGLHTKEFYGQGTNAWVTTNPITWGKSGKISKDS